MRTLRSWFDWQDSMQADNAFAPRCSPQAASAEARTILESAGRVLTEGPAKRLLAAYGVPVVAEEVALDEKSACDAARRLGFPVALKVESLDVPHKTEAGGVRLDLRSEEDVRSAYAAIVRNIRNAIPHARLGGMLVQSMVRRDVEIIIGGKCDPLFGPTVLVGFGGVFVELLKDTVVALAPVSVDEALTMLASLRGHALLKGFRGTPATDELELARIVARVSELIAEQADRIEEIDVNPLVISNGRAIAVDALASLRSREDVGS